ncbi:MAG: Dabb family protein [Lachnospiraceae bacterium]|nr:Dabb family protein [Lachnospiraceae bacterium]
MVNHIVMWNFKAELSGQEKQEAASRIKRELEAVKEQVPGVVSLSVVTDGLPSGNKDIGLISVFESVEALHNYQVHPAHVAAGQYVGSVTEGRCCLDYEA